MKRYIYLITLILPFNIIGQVDINIGDNLIVETSGGLYIEVSGDLEENTTGYLKGIVSSGNRGPDAISQFAGLIINSGAVDKITRTTGSAFSNSNPKTTLRYYEIENTTEFTSNISSELLESGTNDESNGIVNPFLYSNVGSSWTGYLDNSSISNIIGAASFNIPVGSSNIVISEGVGVAAKIYLEGPYTSHAMNTNLSSNISLTSPYAEDPREVEGLPPNTVDWVLVQLRDETTPSTIVSSRSVFLRSDGNLVDDGSNTAFGVPSSPGNYYISIKQRNHLGIMSSSSQTIDWLTP